MLCAVGRIVEINETASFTSSSAFAEGGWLASQYDAVEENYSDNESNVITVTREQYQDQARCTENDIEENDTLESAQPITVNTEYRADLCLDSTDIFSINLSADANYEIIPEGFDFETESIIRLIIIAPNGKFIVNKTGVFGVFQTPTSGEHKVVLTISLIDDHDQREGSFIIREQL